MRAPRLSPTARLLLTLTWLVASCSGPKATAGSIQIQVSVDAGPRLTRSVPSGSTVQQALAYAGVQLGDLDKVDPPGYTVLTQDATIRVTRVVERFVVETVTVPYERQTIRSEGLPAGETRMLQPGANGQQEITYRVVEEGGVEVSRTPVKTVSVKDSQPEIVLIGAQAAFSPVPIRGSLAYLAGGNAWMMRGDTGSRRPLVVTGDLDGRVFRLSYDGRWLLFTRLPPKGAKGSINSLWVVSTTEAEPRPIDLQVRNVVHFADFSPVLDGSNTVAYSTAEPAAGSPGWQADNDLELVSFTSAGTLYNSRTLIPANAGGQYGWWGASFAWAPEGRRLAYARPDAVGVIDLTVPSLNPLLDIVPFQAPGDWAWVPGLTWSADGRELYLVDHGPATGLESSVASPVFDLVALPTRGGPTLSLAPRAGMFAYPSVSPPTPLPTAEQAALVAFLQAISPLDSQESSYRLVVMDRDGSNRRSLFPPPGEAGLAPQPLNWSPDAARLALIYRGDLWLVDVASGVGQRLTGDGTVTACAWRP